MGASIRQIISLNTVNYLWLALIAAMIAFPIAYYFMSRWLKVFPYNPGLSGIPFIISALVIVVTVVITVIFHSTKAAMANPANSLRIE
jgi:putative ABC transport system permease protein